MSQSLVFAGPKIQAWLFTALSALSQNFCQLTLLGDSGQFLWANCHVVKNVLRKPVLIGPIEFDIVIVMSEKATENKVYSRLALATIK